MSDVYLTTDRLVLRRLRPDEGHLFFDLDQDPEVMKYINGGTPSTREQADAAVQRICAYCEKLDHKLGFWIAEERDSGSFIGWFLLRPDKARPDDTKNPELGYRFKREFWGKGYATEGSKALVDKAFQDLDCDTVFADAMSENLASQKVMKKVGMRFIKSFEHKDCAGPGGNASANRFVITRQEWEKLTNLRD